ncbi:MAG: flagellin [Candidatus Tokpelaia sp. JSC189]|nr:MAG: flagellin [Candidatus Tokpelaia sp. JSC189]
MGSSLLTNRAALTALQTLRQIDKAMYKTQQRVSTGLRINQAKDNTAYWSISSMMRTDKVALGAISYIIDLGKEQVHTAYESVVKSKEYVDQIQESLAIMLGTGKGDLEKVRKDIKTSMEGIKTALHSAAMAEKNILLDDGKVVRISASYRREGDKLYIDMIEVGGQNLNFGKPDGAGVYSFKDGVLKEIFGTGNIDETKLTAIKDKAKSVEDAQKVVSAANDPDEGGTESPNAKLKVAKEELQQALKDVTISDFLKFKLDDINTAAVLEGLSSHLQGINSKAVDVLLTAGAELGAAEKQIENQVDFLGRLMASIDKGIGAMVDADMNAESARLSALQVQQQLAIQSLSIANQDSQNILALFRS